MLRFGPAGNADRFYDEGYKSTVQAPQWLSGMGLTAYEYSCGRGVSLSDETALKIREQAEKYGIAVSLHAPYFINLANPDSEKREHSFRYILEAAHAVDQLGGERVVVHTGAMMKLELDEALENCRIGFHEAYKRLEDAGLGHIRLCPETMGKRNQIGGLREILDFCQLDERMLPTVDFAHLHAIGCGAMNTQEDFAAVLDDVETELGLERAQQMHMHFSTIEYTQAGERRHRTFADTDYGPRFELLAPLLKKRGYCGTVICECAGTQADDAAAMKQMWSTAD